MRLRTLNVIDTGLASGLLNQALDRHLLKRVGAGRAYGTLRFYRNTPAVSVGRHQALARELRLDYCRANGIEVVRRASGGGALYLDPGQLGFSLVVRSPRRWRNLTLARELQRASEAVARAMHSLGIAARATAPNDVEVDGRKIASVFVTHDGPALLVHGIVLLDADVRAMLEALRVPTEKLTADGLATARERLTTLAACLGGVPEPCAVKSALANALACGFGVRCGRESSATLRESVTLNQLEAERRIAARIGWDDDGADFLEALVRAPAATLRARARFSAGGERFACVEFAADAHVAPASCFTGLQDLLAELPVVLTTDAVGRWSRRHTVETVGFQAADIVRLLEQLADKQRLTQRHRFSTREANALMPYCADGVGGAEAVLRRASVMLVPYCTKPAWCKWRHRDGCTECGKCEVGDAYRLARGRNMQVTTITSYEHLVATLHAMKAGGVAAYIGMCCSDFFVKRYRAFAEAGMSAVLMDISGANCYELKQESAAYAGTFQAEARLDRDLLARVAALIPTAAARRGWATGE